jgi:hypothetical protein
MPNPQAGGPPLVGCPRLLIKHIHSYPPYPEAIPSIRNLRMRHALVTRDPPNMDSIHISLYFSIYTQYDAKIQCYH